MVYLKVLQAKILRFNAKISGKLSFNALRLCIIPHIFINDLVVWESWTPLGNTNQSTVLVSVFVFYGLFSSFDDPRAGAVVYLFPGRYNLKVFNGCIFSAPGIENIICHCDGKLGIVTAGILLLLFGGRWFNPGSVLRKCIHDLEFPWAEARQNLLSVIGVLDLWEWFHAIRK